MIVKTCASNYSMKCKGRSANPFFAEWSIPIEIRGTSEAKVKTMTQRSKKREVAEINERWSQKTLRGFYKCMDGIREMFQKRYP